MKRALISAQICRTLGDVLAGKESLVARLWETEEVERVRWAICPGIREKKNFYEGLSRRI